MELEYNFIDAERDLAWGLAANVQEDVAVQGNVRPDGTKGNQDIDYLAYLSEIAGARLQGAEPDPKVGNLLEPDLVKRGVGHHFRHSPLLSGGLIIRDRDRRKMGKYDRDVLWCLVGDDQQMVLRCAMIDPDWETIEKIKPWAIDPDGRVWILKEFHPLCVMQYKLPDLLDSLR
jgi:hypothetical protein